MSAKRKPSKAMPVRRLCEVEMKKILLALAIAAGTGQVFAESGSDLLEKARALDKLQRPQGEGARGQIYSGYWIGFIHGTASTLMETDPKVCLPTGSDNRQWSGVVKQYLEQNPAQLHRPAHILVREALQQAFPCR
jgi:hypothetical protein